METLPFEYALPMPLIPDFPNHVLLECQESQNMIKYWLKHFQPDHLVVVLSAAIRALVSVLRVMNVLFILLPRAQQI